MSDGGPSSIKRLSQCAARVPALSRGYENRVEETLDYAVYGSRFAAHRFLTDGFRPNRKSRKEKLDGTIGKIPIKR